MNLGEIKWSNSGSTPQWYMFRMSKGRGEATIYKYIAGHYAIYADQSYLGLDALHAQCLLHFLTSDQLPAR